ncbi:hypothetical protein B0O99DRAFT_607992 [Bisporella sp. PMI_857]|nr:hypothetical protein B0O99DRAFT_607992 [Bisporella sp. PMI_857]
MDDLLLEQLCRICNIHPAKYTCPRCYFPTCSLPCARRHKTRAQCSGERDQTAFVPWNQLATPAGIDHDYNFLHSIEHRVERSEKLIVEEKGLVDKEELRLARAGEQAPRKGPQKSEVSIARSLEASRTKVHRAPKGMMRNLENETTWSTKNKAIHWQVEWLREGEKGRILAKVLGNKPIGEQYAAIVKAEEKILSPKEGKRKRPNQNSRSQALKRRRVEAQKIGNYAGEYATEPVLQDPDAATWSVSPKESAQDVFAVAEPKLTLPSSTILYLLRHQTPANYPKVLAPINPSATLEKALWERTVLEFPTIYVFETESEEAPAGFMLEKDFLSATGQPARRNPFTETKRKPQGLASLKDPDETSDDGTSECDSSEGEASTHSETSEDEEAEEIVPVVWRSGH